MKVYIVFGPEFFCGVYSTDEKAQNAITNKMEELNQDYRQVDPQYYYVEEVEMDGELEYYEDY